MRYNLRFRFFDTEQQAIDFCDQQNSRGTYYKRRRYPAHYTPWMSRSDTDKAHFVAWFYD